MSQRVEFIQSSDFDALSALHAKCFSKGQCWGHGDFERYLSKEAVFGMLCRIHSQVSGFVIVQQVDDVAEILTIAVDPDWQGKKIGKALMCDVTQEMKQKGVEEIFLDVATDNNIAINLYKSLNFERVAVRENYYTRENEKKDAYVFKKRIIARKVKDQYSASKLS